MKWRDLVSIFNLDTFTTNQFKEFLAKFHMGKPVTVPPSTLDVDMGSLFNNMVFSDVMIKTEKKALYVVSTLFYSSDQL